jgi:hypothetical protein
LSSCSVPTQEGSDLDLLVVAETASRVHLAVEIAEAIRPILAPLEFDILIRTPQRWELGRRTPGFVRRALDDLGWSGWSADEKKQSFTALFPDIKQPRPMQEAAVKLAGSLDASRLVLLEGPTVRARWKPRSIWWITGTVCRGTVIPEGW